MPRDQDLTWLLLPQGTKHHKEMTDIVDSKRRSRIMSRIRGRDTTPELVVRRMAHRLGFRFRLHRKDLPGCPDIVFPRFRAAVFVHGCYWHRHKGCRYAYTPKSRVAFWLEKFNKNVAHDRRSEEALRNLGWRVLVIWECETQDEIALRSCLVDHLTMDGQALSPDVAQNS